MRAAECAQADREHRLRPGRRGRVGVRHPPPHRARLAAPSCELLARRRWPTVLLLLGAYSAKAWGWRQLFLHGQRPATLTLAAAGGAASVAGIALPGRCDEVVRFAVVRRCRRRRVSFGAVALSLFLLGLLDAVALAPFASVAAGVSNVGWWIRAGLIVVAVAGVAAAAVVLNLAALARVPRLARFRLAGWVGEHAASRARPAGRGRAWRPRGCCGRSPCSSCSPRSGSAPTSRWPRVPLRLLGVSGAADRARRCCDSGRCRRRDADRVGHALDAGDCLRHRLARARHPDGRGVRGRPWGLARARPATAARAPLRSGLAPGRRRSPCLPGGPAMPPAGATGTAPRARVAPARTHAPTSSGRSSSSQSRSQNFGSSAATVKNRSSAVA